MTGLHASPWNPARAVGPLLEARAPFEAIALRRSAVFAGHGLERGDGLPVVLVPGLGMPQASMGLMAAWLRRIGYRPVPAGLGWVVGCSAHLADRLERSVDSLVESAGRPVALVGHSRGGQLARVVAARRPDSIAGLITLGTPLDPAAVHPMMVAAVSGLAVAHALGARAVISSRCISGRECCATFFEELRAGMPDGVRHVELWSPRDRIVIAARQSDWHEHRIEVDASHTGMVCNASVFGAIAVCLADLNR